jgi:hypothetical protein
MALAWPGGPCALVRCVVQVSIKLVEAPAVLLALLAAGWMGLRILAPWLLFVALKRDEEWRSPCGSRLFGSGEASLGRRAICTAPLPATAHATNLVDVQQS